MVVVVVDAESSFVVLEALLLLFDLKLEELCCREIVHALEPVEPVDQVAVRALHVN